MARLSDRGQMLLIGAVVLAVTFVSLAVVLSGSIQTTTDASEASADVSASEALALHNDVRRDVAALMARAYSADPNSPKQNSHQETTVQGFVDNQLGPRLTSRYAEDGRIVEVQFASATGGTYHFQDSSGTFEHGSSEDWDLATDARVRDFDLVVDGWGAATSDRFTITVSDGGSTTDVEIYDDGGDTAVTVNGVTCTAAGPPTTVNVTAGKVGGEPCPALDFVDEMGPNLDVSFSNGDEITGTYGVVTTGASATQGTQLEDRLYQTVIEVTYRSPSVDYESQVRVAPGEPS